MLLPLLIIFGCSAIVWFLVRVRIPGNFPPGPPGYMSISALVNKNEPYLSKLLVKLSEKYGPVIGLTAMTRRFVCVSGYEAVRDVLNNAQLSGRPDAFEFNLKTSGLRRGVLMTDGELWREQRRFTMHHLKNLGFGKSSLEVTILEEVSDLIMKLEAIVGSSPSGNIILDDVFTLPVVSVLWAVIAGERFERNDPRAKAMLSSVTGFSRASNGGPSILALFPFLRFVAPEWTGFNHLMRHISLLRSSIQDVIQQHRQSRQPGYSRDFLDFYLQSLDDGPANSIDSTFSEEQMMGIVIDIFIAGAETTGYTLGFALLFMMDNPQVQLRVQREIDLVLQGRQPSLSDLKNLPYTEATLQEIQRRGIVAPLTVPHVALEDTTCLGYDLPKVLRTNRLFPSAYQLNIS